MDPALGLNSATTWLSAGTNWVRWAHVAMFGNDHIGSQACTGEPASQSKGVSFRRKLVRISPISAKLRSYLSKICPK